MLNHPIKKDAGPWTGEERRKSQEIRPGGRRKDLTLPIGHFAGFIRRSTAEVKDLIRVGKLRAKRLRPSPEQPQEMVTLTEEALGEYWTGVWR